MKHEVISFDRLNSFYSGTGFKDFDWSPVCSPFNIWCGEKLRAQLHVNLPPSSKYPADLIVWGRGEPENLALTKVGGSPVWSSESDYPHELAYFGQVGLMDSPEVLRMVNGDVISIWGDNEFPYGKIKAFELHSKKLTYIPEARSVDVVANKEPFYGALYRSFDVGRNLWDDISQIEVEGELRVRKFRFLPWKGSKIGGISSALDEKRAGGFVLQIMSIQGHPEQRYPWVNIEDELPVSGDTPNSYTADQNCVPIGDMGFVTVEVKNGVLDAKLIVQ